MIQNFRNEDQGLESSTIKTPYPNRKIDFYVNDLYQYYQQLITSQCGKHSLGGVELKCKSYVNWTTNWAYHKHV